MSYYRSDRDAGVIAPRSGASAPPSQRRGRRAARLVGAVGMVTLTAVLFWLLTDDAFRVSEASVRFEGLRHADETEVRALLTDLDRAPNIFRVRAGDIVSDLSSLTEVDGASATMTLPADVSVYLDERDPVFIWSDGEFDWLVDEEGMLFAPGEPALAGTADPDAAADAGPDEAVDVAARAALPLVEDARLTDPAPTVGTFLPASDQAVMRQLLAVTPELLGSRAQDLHLRVDELQGYVLEGRDRGWRAIFGHYTPSLQSPQVIPAQVQCLRWLLASEERRLDEIRLVPSDATCGTFTKIQDQKGKDE